MNKLLCIATAIVLCVSCTKIKDTKVEMRAYEAGNAARQNWENPDFKEKAMTWEDSLYNRLYE